ncbi:MAG: hypothetical protein H6Q60_1046 [Oscillospiraceae bacterium]|nr:hypothetical protein [Oscillospiraceae bacterium]
MRQGKPLTKALMLLLMVTIVTYIGVYLWQSINNPFRTAIAYSQTVNDSQEIEGLVVRSETVLTGAGTLVEQLCSEGENVANQQQVALLYSSQDALLRKQQMEALEDEKEQLEYALSSSGSAEDASSMDASIIAAIAKLHTEVSQGDLSDLDDSALNLKSLTLKHSYLFDENGESLTDIQTQINNYSTQISQLSSQSSLDTTSVTAPCSGLFSGSVDGYESLITPSDLDSLTVSSLQSLLSQSVTASSGSLGKIITGINWYFAAVMDEASASRLESTADLVFSQDYTGEISMTVDRVSETEDGQCVVVFSTDTCLADITLLRKQTAELVFTTYSGIRVPTDAIRFDETGRSGVYTVTGLQAKFKPVDIIYSGEGYYLVSPTSEASDSDYLRAGEEIVIAAVDLYDGKIVG